MKGLGRGIFALIGIIVLILDTKTAADAIRSGILQCTATVIPSLLPFFVLSTLLTASVAGRQFQILRPVERVCKMSPGSGTLLLMGVLGGYPTGAHNIVQLYRSRQISREHAVRLLWFCSNTGPAFIFGIVANQFTRSWAPWMLWLIHILSAILVGIIAPKDYSGVNLKQADRQVTLLEAVEQAGKSMAKVCLWILMFRVLLAFLQRWFLWLLPTPGPILLSGILELTIGCTSLSGILQEGHRFVICAGFLSFGSICVVLQTAAISGDLGIKHYIAGKSIQALLSILLAICLWYSSTQRTASILMIICIICVFSVIFCLKSKNKGSIVAQSGV